MRLNLSIGARLTLFVAAFVALVIVLASVTAISLRVIDQSTEAIDHKWLAGTQMLGEMSDQISEFRIAETYRALAIDKRSMAEAELLADQHRGVIEDLQKEYTALLGI